MDEITQSRRVRGGWSRRVFLLAAMLICMTTTLGCEDRAANRPAGDGKPVVVTSIAPLASLIEPLVGDWGRVEAILPSGVSVHGFEPMANQLRMAGQADMLVVVGRNLDGWAENLVRRAQPKGKAHELPVITFAVMLDGAKGRNTLQTAHDHHGHDHDHSHNHAHDHAHDHTGPNAHLWVDPVLARQFVKWITPQIQSLAPDAAARQQTIAAAEALDEKLAALDQQYKAALADVKRKELVTFHNAFDLLAQRYGLKVVAHMTDVDLAPGGEITSNQLIDVIKSIREHELKVIYAEPQFPDRAVAVVTRETGAAVYRLDDLGGQGVPGYEDYFQMMQTNLQTLVKGQNLE